MDYILIIVIIISIIFLISILYYMNYLSSFGLIVSTLVILNMFLVILIKLYNGRGFFCSDLDSKASVDFSFENELKDRTINYIKDYKNE